MADIGLETYEIFKQIENTSSKNDKVAIIKANSGNEEFKSFLKFLYDEMITTGLSSKKINKKISLKDVDTKEFEEPMQVMNYLMKFNTGTDTIIYSVQRFLETIEDEEYKEFLKSVFTKSYKCGITSGSVNKALGKDFIKEFKVQLAHPYSKFSDKVNDWFGITQKLDGHRTLAIIKDGNVTFRTRKGHEINGLDELKEDFLNFYQSGKAVVFDGEVTIEDDSIPMEKVFQETSKLLRKDGIKTGLKFNMFDFIPYEDFFDGETVLRYKERRMSLTHLFNHNSYKPRHIGLVKMLYSGYDKDEIGKWLAYALENGWEGIMLNLDTPYYCKRHSGILKVKEFSDCDVLVSDVFEGQGKYEGTLGGIVIDYKDWKVKVGSGFTDEQRDYFWKNKDEIVGKIVQVQHFGETTNQKDEALSLRFPVFKNTRLDKTLEDISYE